MHDQLLPLLFSQSSDFSLFLSACPSRFIYILFTYFFMVASSMVLLSNDNMPVMCQCLCVNFKCDHLVADNGRRSLVKMILNKNDIYDPPVCICVYVCSIFLFSDFPFPFGQNKFGSLGILYGTLSCMLSQIYPPYKFFMRH
jgi:hypothetical protein